MNFTNDLKTLMILGYPIIYVLTDEEERIEYSLQKLKLGNTSFLSIIQTWDFAEGYNINPNNQNIASQNPVQALNYISSSILKSPTIFVLRDFHKFLKDNVVSRKLKNMSRNLEMRNKTIIITANEINIPSELKNYITILNFELPNEVEINKELKLLIQTLGQEKSVDKSLLESLTRACQGLTFKQIRRVFTKSILLDKKVSVKTLNLILDAKREFIKQTEILEFSLDSNKLTSVGGLESLKQWLKKREKAFSEKAQNYNLPLPRGLFLVGFQGTGKSLTASAIANEWNLPLFRLDIGTLFGGIVGESESRVRGMIRMAEKLAPCIILIDEIDKALKDSKGDSGTTNRVLSTLLTWLADKKSPVCVIATANDIEAIPLEFIRKGRFDEIFFLTLPTLKERKSIFEVQLKLVRPDSWKSYDIDLLSQATKDFSGAEIRQSVIEAMHIGFMEKREFTTQDILTEIKQIIPLARIDTKKMQILFDWAVSGRVRLASNSSNL